MFKYSSIIIVVIVILVLGCNKSPNPNMETPTQPESESDKENKDMNIRKSVLAGSWYPENPEALKKSIEKYLNGVKLPNINSQEINAIIVPHAGHQYSGQCAAYGYSLIKGKPFKRIIIIGPSHTVGFIGVSVSKATHYETPLGKVEVDSDACDTLLKNDKLFSYQSSADMNDHSLEIQLPFLQTVLSGYKIVPLIAGEIDDYQDTASAIKKIVDKQTLIIISSDFTHYGDDFGFVPFTDNIKDNLKKLDGGAIDLIINISPEGFYKYVKSTGATICGYKPISLLLSIIDTKNIFDAKGILLNYYTSGDLTGDYSRCVSYAAIAFRKLNVSKPKEEQDKDNLSESEKKTLLSLARETLKLYLKSQKIPQPNEKDLPAKLTEKRGVFVTLKERGQLRGCIGRIFEPQPLYQGVIAEAVDSAVNDWRFSPVTADEEKAISIEISVMSPLKKVDGYKDIIVGKHGVYLVKGGRTAIFLPQVALEQGWTLEEMLNNLAEKAGLPVDGWRNGAEFFVFTAQVFSEKE
ncbi:MAG: AmmeMemoRadiSam system protein B [Planctomycetota bacterium]